MIIAFCCCLRLVIVDHRFYSRPPASFPWEALGYTYHHQPGKLLVRPRPQRLLLLLLRLKIHHCKKDNTRTSWAQISSNKDVKIWEVLQPQQSPFPSSLARGRRGRSRSLYTAICSSFCRHQKQEWWRNYDNTFECLWFSFKLPRPSS